MDINCECWREGVKEIIANKPVKNISMKVK
jgi:hypothetical protein